jgi:ABC-type transport system involved in multi-copper enzyme maturation permease subunit
MTAVHIVLTTLLSLGFIVFVFYVITRGVLHARYAILWLCIGFTGLFSPFFYYLGVVLREWFLFPTPSIFLLMGAILLLSLICLQLTVAASRARRERKNLAQRLALLEYAFQNKTMPAR